MPILYGQREREMKALVEAKPALPAPEPAPAAEAPKPKPSQAETAEPKRAPRKKPEPKT